MAIKITAPPKTALINHHKIGKNYTDIGRMYGVSRSTVKNWFKEYGLYSPPGKRAVKVPPREELDELIAGGMSSERLAGKYQVHVTTISLWLRTYKLLSLRARAQFRRMEEKVGKPKPVKPKFDAPATKFNLTDGVPQFIGLIEHSMQAREL